MEDKTEGDINIEKHKNPISKGQFLKGELKRVSVRNKSDNVQPKTRKFGEFV